MTDRVLADRYELKERLGSGGMAEVYRAEDRVLRRDVAVKILHPRFARDPTYVARFRREARVAARVTHPNVVATFDTRHDDGTRFIVMEYVRGRTLKDVIAEEGAMSPDRIVAIAVEVCEGLAAAHRHGLVHRDIKPANIMLAEDGTTKVTDFGIARATASETLTGTAVVMGTAAYLSPEQARGDPVDARSDLYALGCVLYEMAAGAPPFTGEHPVTVAARHVHDAAPPLADEARDGPAGLAPIIMRCLEKDPERRYPDADTLREALLGSPAEVTAPIERGEGTEVLPADPPAAGASTPAPPGRWRFPAVLVALALLGFLLAWAFRSLAAPAPRTEGGSERRASGGDSSEEMASPTPPVLVSLEEAYLALVGEVEEGVLLGELDEKEGGEVLDRARKAMEQHGDGDVDRALDEMGKLRERLIDRTPDKIEPSRTRAILEVADALEASLGGQPPPG